MLSKSAAKAFFLGGTALTSAVFLSLTWDRFQQIPDGRDSLVPADQADWRRPRDHRGWLYVIVGFTFLSGILGAGNRSTMGVTT
jgi:hypothetical protein